MFRLFRDVLKRDLLSDCLEMYYLRSDSLEMYKVLFVPKL
jgi:hypothetical protein